MPSFFNVFGRFLNFFLTFFWRFLDVFWKFSERFLDAFGHFLDVFWTFFDPSYLNHVDNISNWFWSIFGSFLIDSLSSFDVQVVYELALNAIFACIQTKNDLWVKKMTAQMCSSTPPFICLSRPCARKMDHGHILKLVLLSTTKINS